MGMALAVSTPSSLWAQEAVHKTDVLVIPSLHHFHRVNKHYTYDDLYRAVDNFRPQFVGVEIRQEDLALGDHYLGDNYPQEMIELFHHYAPHVFGFDWLGDDLAGRPVPDDWWRKRSEIKILERSVDSYFKTNPLLLQSQKLSREQLAIAQRATLPQMMDGSYDRVAASYYAVFKKLTAGTEYQKLSDFYTERDMKLSDNIINFLVTHFCKRVVIVTGADHHGPMVKSLSCQKNINIVSII